MTAFDILFNIFVICAFFTSGVDHFFAGKGMVLKPIRAFLLGCFLFTETYLAIENPVLWLYVLLNFWGLGNLFFGGRVPFRWTQRK